MQRLRLWEKNSEKNRFDSFQSFYYFIQLSSYIELIGVSLEMW